MRRIEERIERFLDGRRNRPFTVLDVINEVRWDGSKKQLAKLIKLNKRIRNFGHKREAGKRLRLYSIADTTGPTGLYGKE